MAVYAIGDVQGCYDELRRLLDRLHFDPADDQLWLAGDLVNRGPQSLEVLRFAQSLGKRAKTVLGNHDLHLLAMAYGVRKPKANDTARAVLDAPDAADLIHWLQRRPLLHHSKKRQWTMVHAGIPPQWSLKDATARAKELQKVLDSDRAEAFFQGMYGNGPERWSDKLKGQDRLRYIVNAFTRMRYCRTDGSLEFSANMSPHYAPGELTPWFYMPERKTRKHRIVFGHWSTAGYLDDANVIALDTGCVWGGELTAIRLRKRPDPPQRTDVPCQGALRPGQA